MTELERMRRAVELQKTKKVQAEAKLEAIASEEKHLQSSVEQQTGKKLVRAEEMEQHAAELQAQITQNIAEMRKIFKNEEVSY